MSNVINLSDERSKRSKARHELAEQALTARAAKVAFGEVIDSGFDDDEESNLAGYNSRRRVYDGE
jgi:hypothetical protein